MKNLSAVKDGIAQLTVQGVQHQNANLAELQAIKTAITDMASSNKRQGELFERFTHTMQNMTPLSTDRVFPLHEKRTSGRVLLIVIGILTCLTIIGTCGFYIYKTLM